MLSLTLAEVQLRDDSKTPTFVSLLFPSWKKDFWRSKEKSLSSLLDSHMYFCQVFQIIIMSVFKKYWRAVIGKAPEFNEHAQLIIFGIMMILSCSKRQSI